MSHEGLEIYDVAIIGGGPGGTTTGTLLKKYNPELRVLILEREKFPRDHVGESQLPPISPILNEMECWDKVEAANFPIKIGGTFRWGKSANAWDIQFIPRSEFKQEPRPGKFEGVRRFTAFQVTRSIYDEILLRHAEEKGCEVREQTRVTDVLREGDAVQGLRLDTGEVVKARYYVDASGHHGILRNAFGVQTHCPTRLKNIAIWDYWENGDWAVDIGVGGTLIQIISLDFGWIWFIPLGRTRTSIGLVCPAEYFKNSGKTPEELYAEAVQSEPTIKRLLAQATCRNSVCITKDWSFISERMVGDNWFLVGESAGFADPILSAGLTLAHIGGKEAAYTLLALLRGEHEPQWLKKYYDLNQRRRIRQHIRFADFFYAANGQFKNLREHCKEIAEEAGLELTPDAAWRWISQGGFTNEAIGQPAIAGFDLDSARQVAQMLTREEFTWQASDYNVFHLDLEGAVEEFVPVYFEGRIHKTNCYFRGNYRLPFTGMYGLLLQVLRYASDIETIFKDLIDLIKSRFPAAHARVAFRQAIQVLEIMVSEGWVKASLDETKPRLNLSTPVEGLTIYSSIGEILSGESLEVAAT
jgi:flavin-dependent dehydrogenase